MPKAESARENAHENKMSRAHNSVAHLITLTLFTGRGSWRRYLGTVLELLDAFLKLSYALVGLLLCPHLLLDRPQTSVSQSALLVGLTLEPGDFGVGAFEHGLHLHLGLALSKDVAQALLHLTTEAVGEQGSLVGLFLGLLGDGLQIVVVASLLALLLCLSLNPCKLHGKGGNVLVGLPKLVFSSVVALEELLVVVDEDGAGISDPDDLAIEFGIVFALLV